MYTILKTPINIINEFPSGKGHSPKKKAYKSAPGLVQDNTPSVAAKSRPDADYAEFHPRKIVYGEKDIEV